MASEVNGVLVAAHELKAPLSLMRQLALSLEMANDDDRNRVCAQMINVSERALRQVNDLTKIARLEDGLFAMEPVSVRGVCEMVARDMVPLFGFDRKSLKIEYRNRHKLAIANQDLLYSVIYNFCTNAMRYSSPDTYSMMTVNDSTGYIRINVRDYGPALPIKVWQELNTGRFSESTDVAMRPGSSGLGLYIASKFAEYMHAKIGAIRHRDGTSFFLELPRSQQACLF